MPRSRRVPQHIRKLIDDLADVVYGEAIASAAHKAVRPYQDAAQRVVRQLVRQGVTPIEAALLVQEMREDAEKLKAALSR